MAKSICMKAKRPFNISCKKYYSLQQICKRTSSCAILRKYI